MDAAAFQGTYSDLKLVKTRSVFQVVVELPIEKHQSFVAAFGTPIPGRESPVALALMTSPGGVPPAPSPVAGDNSAESGKAERKRFDDLPLSQQAALLCRDERFQRWAWREHQNNGYSGAQVSQEDARRLILWACGISSRAELERADYGQYDTAVAEFKKLKARYYEATGQMAEAR